MRSLLKLARGIDGVSEWLGKAGIYLTILIIGVGFYNVAARYIGRFIGVQLSSNTWIETQKYLFTLIFLLMFAYNLKHEVNVRVDFLYAKWSPRRRAWVDLLGTLLFLLPYCIMGIWVSINPLTSSWRLWEMSPDPGGLPRAPLRALVPLALGMLALQGVAQVIKYIGVLIGRFEIEQELEANQPPVGTSPLG